MIKHHFVAVPEAVDLFDVANFNQFQAKLKKLSKVLPTTDPVRWNVSLNPQDNQNKILGDAFELFCELFVLHFGFHPQIGLSNYTPIDPELDEGIDAFADNLLNKKSAVQCKYVSDEKHEFGANKSNLPNFLVEATLKKIAWNRDTKIRRAFLITTAKGLHYHTEKKWNNRVQVINGDVIKSLTLNNKIFWQSCQERIREVNG